MGMGAIKPPEPKRGTVPMPSLGYSGEYHVDEAFHALMIPTPRGDIACQKMNTGEYVCVVKQHSFIEDELLMFACRVRELYDICHNQDDQEAIKHGLL